jgi:LacI family transcriptional regulator
MNRKKEITIYDIADKLNISVATVSRGLKDSDAVSKRTRKRIFELAEKMGYRSNHFARNLRQQHTNTIGVIVHELNSTFITSVLAGIEKITAAAGYDIIITHSSESFEKEAANAENLFHKRVDGLIASLSFDTSDLDHYKPFADKGIPVIFFDRVEQDTNNSVVIIDNRKCGYLATRHLIEQGCVRIAHVTSSLKRNVYSERYKGYQDALCDSGIPFEENLVMIKNLSENAGIDAATEILEMKPVPDGIFFTSDFVAAVAMRTLKERGIAIPEDIAIVGFNNDVIGTLVEPALTTINYPGINMGEIAARSLISHLKGTSDIGNTKCIIVRSELLVRKSSLKGGVKPDGPRAQV